MSKEWDGLHQVLENIYKEKNIYDEFYENERYLKQAYYKTEELWIEQYEKIKKVKYVMISEAPLFGKAERYIYNLNTSPSSFFYFQDLTSFNAIDITKIPKSAKDKKSIMLHEFADKGLIVLDLFPFAFNQEDTKKINYRNISRTLYKKLFLQSAKYYLIPKLQMMKKIDSNTQFFYRYERVHKHTGILFEDILKEATGLEFITESISGSNMSLDRNKLERILSI